jgi:hypothetical protein
MCTCITLGLVDFPTPILVDHSQSPLELRSNVRSYLAKEGYHVMLAHAIELYILTCYQL